MNFTFIPGENIVKEEDNVWYFGRHSEYKQIMIGKLTATSNRLIFYQKEPTLSKTLETKGVVFNIPLDQLIAVKFEKRIRSNSSKPKWDNQKIYRQIVKKERTINLPPTLLDGKNIYNVLIIAFQGISKIENLIFEVIDPLGWLKFIKTVKTFDF